MAELTLKQIAEDLADKHGITKKKAYEMCKEIPSVISAHLRADSTNTASLGGLCKFKTTTRAERKGRNPKTGENITIPERTVMVAKFGSNAFIL